MRNWLTRTRTILFLTVVLSSILLAHAALSDSHKLPMDTITINADNQDILYSGRIADLGEPSVTLAWSGTRARMRFEGNCIAMLMEDPSGQNSIQAFLDGQAMPKIQLSSSSVSYPLAKNLAQGPHTIEIIRATEANLGLVTFKGFQLDKKAKPLPWGDTPKRNIEFIGDSITCGYGVETNNPEEAFSPQTENFCLGYSALTARALNADYLVVSRSGIGMIREYDGPYEGSEEKMPLIYPYARYNDPSQAWDFSKFTPDVVCINLGTNDFSTSGVNTDKYTSTYVEFAQGIFNHYPHTQLVLIQGPMENGSALQDALQNVLQLLSTDHPQQVHYLKLSPQGNLGYGADWHPSQEQSKVNALELTAFLSQLMHWD